VTSLLTLGLALAHYGYWALALGQLIPSVLFTAYVCSRVRWRPTVGYRHSAMRKVLDFGFWNVLKTQLEFVLGHVDKVFLGRFAGMTDLGYYDKAQSIAVVPSGSFIASLNAVLFSSFSQRKDDSEDVRELLRKGLMTVSVLSFPVYAGLVVVAGPFVVGLLGAKWSPMIVPFQIVALAFTVRSTLGFLVAVNVALGQYKAYTIRYAVAGCVFIAACALLIPYGPTGIAAAFLLFAAVSVGLGLQQAVGTLALPWSEVLRACWPATKATLCMLTATVPLSFALPGRTLVNLVLIALTGASVYAACLSLESNLRFLALKRAMFADWGGWTKRTRSSRPYR
jgi:PST family polysaccharide transporter